MGEVASDEGRVVDDVVGVGEGGSGGEESTHGHDGREREPHLERECVAEGRLEKECEAGGRLRVSAVGRKEMKRGRTERKKSEGCDVKERERGRATVEAILFERTKEEAGSQLT